MPQNSENRKELNLSRALIAALKRKDNALRQYAYITSHELRSPIASILGLVQLWQEHENDETFCKALIAKIHQCALELDLVAHKLNQVACRQMDALSTQEREICQY